jgi:hypothetical protein
LFILSKVAVEHTASNLYRLAGKAIAVDEKLGGTSCSAIAFGNSRDVRFFEADL